MYEAGPQVLSPVRKPNQVDTVTWDVTREFLHSLANIPCSNLTPCPVLQSDLHAVSSRRGPLFPDFPAGLIREQRERFSYQFVFPFIVLVLNDEHVGQNNTIKAPFREHPFTGRTNREERDRAGRGNRKSKEDAFSR